MAAIPDLLFFQEGPGVRNTQYTTSGVKLINVANLQEGKVDLSTSDRFISEEEAYGKYKHFLVDDGDFIIASSGIQVDYFEKKMGFVSSSQLPLCMNTSTIRFKSLDNNRLNIRFFMYYLKTIQFKEQLSRLITGTAQLNFGPSHIKRINIPLPPLSIQQKIADVLDRASALIEKRKAQIEKLGLLVKSRFVEMFGDPVTNPMGWGEKTFNEVCEVIYRYPTFYGFSYVENGIPVVRIGDISENGEIIYRKDDYVHIESEVNAKYPITQLRMCDVLMAVRGDGSTVKRIGKVIDPELINANISPNLLLMRADNKIVTSNYFFTFVTSSGGQKRLEQYVTKTAKRTITARDVKTVLIPVPPLALQNRFAEFVRQADKSKSEMQRGLDKLEQLYKSLMQKCFSGEMITNG